MSRNFIIVFSELMCDYYSDVDECATNNGGCSVDATCANTDGAHICTCKSGFEGDGVTCTGKPDSACL